MHLLTSDSDTGWKVENVADVKGCDGEGLVTVWERSCDRSFSILSTKKLENRPGRSEVG